MRSRKLQAAKPRMPASLQPLADKAIERHMVRPIPPRIVVSGDIEGEGLQFSSPYADEDQDRWEGLLFEAFGTRSAAVMRHFLSTLSRLCERTSHWEGEGEKAVHFWVPDQDQFDGLLEIVNSIRPRNAAQAAYAAQLCALHLASMRLATRTISYPEPRTIATQVRTTRAFGDGLEQMQRIQGKRRSVRQKITVETHKHEHIHYHEGDGGNGARVVEASRTVPGQEQAHREPLSIASSEGPPRMPPSRRIGRNGSAGR